MKRMNGFLLAGLILTGILTAMILVSFFWTPYDPNAMEAGPKLCGPSLVHWMGTDSFLPSPRPLWPSVPCAARPWAR